MGNTKSNNKDINKLPVIVTVIPTFMEERWIEKCLRSLVEQTYPSHLHRIHVVDGGSTDRTTEIVNEMKVESVNSNGPKIILIDNPDKFVPHARNKSLSQMTEDIELIFEMNSHGWVPEDHLVTRVVDLLDLEREIGRKIGGIGTTVVESDEKLSMIPRWIEATLSSSWGNGGGTFSKFKGRKKSIIPPLTIYRREALVAIGGYDNYFITSQDSELNLRLNDNDWPTYRSDVSYVRIAKRRNFKQWILFSHRYGFWRMKHLLLAPRRASPPEFAPIIGTLVTISLIFMGIKFWWLPAAIYGFVMTGAGFLHSLKWRDPTMLIGVPLMLFILHTCFSIGLIDGIFRKGGAPSDRV